MKKLFIFSLLLVVSIFNINAQDITPSKDKTLVKEVSLETSHQHVSKMMKELCFSNSINGYNHTNWRNLETVDLLKKELLGLEKMTVLEQRDLKFISELKLGQSVDQIHLNIRDYFGSEASVLQIEAKQFLKK
ncbi:hypothetical protein [Flammeovirga sp. EKP202]|uniref:hypothetical protein n=1 Tax=Flammeovirga sp. EKP202 TaxID=2770592 RepID=UPI00165F7210|nr:hypothetical protein [Flammeovirga sp. EKP202]MBD0404845.1 hypothetical protein [Flammeovirga sp. EKP202]